MCRLQIPSLALLLPALPSPALHSSHPLSNHLRRLRLASTIQMPILPRITRPHHIKPHLIRHHHTNQRRTNQRRMNQRCTEQRRLRSVASTPTHTIIQMSTTPRQWACRKPPCLMCQSCDCLTLVWISHLMKILGSSRPKDVP